MDRAIFRFFNEVAAPKIEWTIDDFLHPGKSSLDPLGLTSIEFKKDGRGNPLPASGFELTAREWARFGELFLGRGNYHGNKLFPQLARIRRSSVRARILPTASPFG